MIIDQDGFEVCNLCLAALSKINRQLCNFMTSNNNEPNYESPFLNTGNKFSNEVFEVIAYDWKEDYEKGIIQPYNFKWREVEIKWYKHCNRSVYSNIELSPEKIGEMLDKCLESLKGENYTVEKTFDNVVQWSSHAFNLLSHVYKESKLEGCPFCYLGNLRYWDKELPTDHEPDCQLRILLENYK